MKQDSMILFLTNNLRLKISSFPLLEEIGINNGGSKIVFVKDGLIVNRLTEFESNISETICLELTISNKKWFIMFVYRPPDEGNKKVFFEELTNTLNKATNKYDNIFVSGDFNIDMSNNAKDRNNYLSDFIDNFLL